MKIPRNKPSDVVFEAVLRMTEDMVDGVKTVVGNYASFNCAFINIAKSLQAAHENIERHITKNKWLKPEDQAALKIRIQQIDAITATCIRMATMMQRNINATIREMHRFESTRVLQEVIEKIDIPGEDKKKYDA